MHEGTIRELGGRRVAAFQEGRVWLGAGLSVRVMAPSWGETVSGVQKRTLWEHGATDLVSAFTYWACVWIRRVG